MKNIKSGAMLFAKIAVTVLMSFFITMSVSLLCNAAFTKPIGYIVSGVKEGSDNSEELYTHYYSDGEDTKAEEYNKQGYTLSKQTLRSHLSGTGDKVFAAVSQTISIVILLAFVYSQLWNQGSKDLARVKINTTVPDKLKGLKIGLIASVPSFCAWLWLLLCGIGINPSFKISSYKLMSYHYYIFDTAAAGSAAVAGDLKPLQYFYLFLPLLIVPLFAQISYTVGYKNISISEKLTYKKIKSDKE